MALWLSDNVAVLEERDLGGGDARIGLKWCIGEPGLLNPSPHVASGLGRVAFVCFC